ncbi:MAG: hypothetical protein LUG96_01295 [Tannerellaceae bacterium]|nr:hypothetical protein [Tannerellaceae bacterium]MCC8198592.1 hypothetical protein [Tannerellaceae bacterium]MCD7914014.1 hypothetical protein [Tannerellaceae bacterium]
MRINKDLVDAIMMLTFIILVLTGTSDFENTVTKDLVMIGLGIVAVAMIILRVLNARNPEDKESHH